MVNKSETNDQKIETLFNLIEETIKEVRQYQAEIQTYKGYIIKAEIQRNPNRHPPDLVIDWRLHIQETEQAIDEACGDIRTYLDYRDRLLGKGLDTQAAE